VSFRRLILVVEDDEDLRDSIVEALHAKGFAVMTASEGAEALRVLERITPDVVVLDLMMPGMDGYAFLQERASRPAVQAVPVVVASAAPPPASHAESLWNEFIPKPFTMTMLLDAIDHVCLRLGIR
jgi:DNA-binding response OmpR family regulator